MTPDKSVQEAKPIARLQTWVVVFSITTCALAGCSSELTGSSPLPSGLETSAASSASASSVVATPVGAPSSSTLSAAETFAFYETTVCSIIKIGGPSAPTDSLGSWRSYWEQEAATADQSAKLLLHPPKALPPEVTPFFNQLGTGVQKIDDSASNLAKASSVAEGESLLGSASESAFEFTSVQPDAGACRRRSNLRPM